LESIFLTTTKISAFALSATPNSTIYEPIKRRMEWSLGKACSLTLPVPVEKGDPAWSDPIIVIPQFPKQILMKRGQSSFYFMTICMKHAKNTCKRKTLLLAIASRQF
jgi:hypothetical protein